MNGLEFEHFLEVLFAKMGYETEITKTSGDQGIDSIASKDGTKLVSKQNVIQVRW
jgi:HJR/Mrr/RecB family endonuclease